MLLTLFFSTDIIIITNSPIIQQHKTGQIKLTASNLKKVTIIEGFPRPGPNLPHAPYIMLSIFQAGNDWFRLSLYI